MEGELLYFDFRQWSDNAWFYGILFFLLGSPIAYWIARVTRSRVPWAILVVLPVLAVAETGAGYLVFLDKCEHQTHMRKFASASPRAVIRREETAEDGVYIVHGTLRFIDGSNRQLLAESQWFRYKSGLLARAVAGENAAFSGLRHLTIACQREYPESFLRDSSDL